MKIEIKNRLTDDVIFSYEKENNTIKDTVEEAIRVYTNLEYANLKCANLEGVSLEYANLEGANLEYANLKCANLEGASLGDVNLKCANLEGANLDYSQLDLSCKSLKMKTDRRIRVQIAFHFLSLIKHGISVSRDERKIYKYLKKYANEFHREDVDRLD